MLQQSAGFYGSIAAARIVGVSLRQFYYWVDVLHVVRPQARTCGTRTFRRFTETDLHTLQEMKVLVSGGYTPRAAVRIVNGRPTD